MITCLPLHPSPLTPPVTHLALTAVAGQFLYCVYLSICDTVFHSVMSDLFSDSKGPASSGCFLWNFTTFQPLNNLLQIFVWPLLLFDVFTIQPSIITLKLSNVQPIVDGLNRCKWSNIIVGVGVCCTGLAHCLHTFLERASALQCYFPGWCMISMLYSAKISSHLATWPSGCLKLCNHLNALWSVRTLKLCLYRYGRKCWAPHTRAHVGLHNIFFLL